ncbi:hypothetical protein EV424DRAFT_1348349 [Suillus variegatus]|nr:hypothetical protein EV424DRAFT_1348349 [Suillus variegatus]
MAGAIGRSSAGKRARIYLVKRGNAVDGIQSDAASRAVYSLVKTIISDHETHESLHRKSLRDEAEVWSDLGRCAPPSIPEGLNAGLQLCFGDGETFLKTLIIISDAKITDEGSLGTSSFMWSYVSSMDIPGLDLELVICVGPASSSKCPWCWTYTREEQHDLCPCCEDV